MSFRKIKAEFSVPITSFPESLHPLLKEIDGPEGNGALETDELTEVFEMYAAAKKANEEGCIALKSLPQELQKTLEVFDVDGDGTVGTAELAYVCCVFQPLFPVALFQVACTLQACFTVSLFCL